MCKYTAIFKKDKDGVTVWFPDLPGCLTCGITADEAKDSASKALRCFLDTLEENGRTPPEPSKCEHVQNDEWTEEIEAVSELSEEEREEFETMTNGEILVLVPDFGGKDLPETLLRKVEEVTGVTMEGGE